MFLRLVVFNLFFSSAVFAASPPPLLTAQPADFIQQLWYIENDGSHGGVVDADIDLKEAWAIVDQAPTVPVAVIDMDFDLDHPEMKGVYDLSLSKDFSGHSFKRMTDWSGDVQHGGMSSALIGANGFDQAGTTGVSKKSRIIALNISQFDSTPINLSEVIKYAVDAGARVINCSIGIENPTVDELKALREGVEYAADHDVVIVASAGNWGVDNDQNEFYPANFSREFKNVISVGASTRRDQVWKHSQFGLKSVDLFAPGEDILIAAKSGIYLVSEGTSEAAPIVAGVVALMRQVNPNLSAFEVKEILRATVDPSEAFKNKCVSGGRLNAHRAVSSAQAAYRTVNYNLTQ